MCHVLQVEFYFSDSNLPRDRFLSDRVAAEPEGFVDLALLCTFQRMQGLLKSNVGDAAKVAEQTLAGVAQALAPSLTLVLSDDKLRVRRRVVRPPPPPSCTAPRPAPRAIPVFSVGGPPSDA